MSGKGGADASAPTTDPTGRRGASFVTEGVLTIFSWVTIFPVPQVNTPFDQVRGQRAIAHLPVVGIVFGVITALIAAVCLALHIPPLLPAVLIVASWLLLTRMMHLDGMCDVADALGSFADPAKAHKILSDSSTGALGMGGAAIVLSTQVAVVASLLSLPDPGVAVVAVGLLPVLARLGGMICCVRPMAPFNPQSFGALMIGTLPKRWVGLWLVALGLVAGLISRAVMLGVLPDVARLNQAQVNLVFVATIAPILVGVVTCVIAAVWVNFLSRRFAGLNGDCIGATVEVSTAVAGLVMTVLLFGAYSLWGGI